MFYDLVPFKGSIGYCVSMKIMVVEFLLYHFGTNPKVPVG